MNELKEILKTALNIVETLPDIYRLDAFKIILPILLKNNIVGTSKENINTNEAGASNDITSYQNLAGICNLSEDELKNVIEFKDDTIDIVCGINGKEKHRQLQGALVLLLSYEVLMNSDWIPAIKIKDSLRKIGIQDKGGNFAAYLKSRGDLFLKHGNENEYRLTTNNGKKIASRIILKLSKAEEITDDDLQP